MVGIPVTVGLVVTKLSNEHAPMLVRTAEGFAITKLSKSSLEIYFYIFERGILFSQVVTSVTRKKSPNVQKSCPKMISLEKQIFSVSNFLCKERLRNFPNSKLTQPIDSYC